MSKYFRLGQFVKVSSDNDNDGYNDFRNDKLKIVEKYTSQEQCFAYDSCMDGMPLYGLYNLTKGKDVDVMLYDYELEKW